MVARRKKAKKAKKADPGTRRFIPSDDDDDESDEEDRVAGGFAGKGKLGRAYSQPLGVSPDLLDAVFDPGKHRLIFCSFADGKGGHGTWSWTMNERARVAKFTGQELVAAKEARAQTRALCVDGQSVAQVIGGVRRPQTAALEGWGAYLGRQAKADGLTGFYYGKLALRRAIAIKKSYLQRANGKMVASFARAVGPPSKYAIHIGDGFRSRWEHMPGMPPTQTGAIFDAFVWAGYTVGYLWEHRSTVGCSRPGCAGRCERFKPGVDGFLVWGLIKCSQCGLVYQRDWNATRNMIYIALALRQGKPRPLHLCTRAVREAATAAGARVVVPQQ